MLFSRNLISVCAMCVAGLPVAASGQMNFTAMVIGNIVGQMAAEAKIDQCMRGLSPPKKEDTEKSRLSVTKLMKDYVSLASAGDHADVSALFTEHGKQRWVNGQEILKTKNLIAVHDPYAHDATLMIAAEPNDFVRGGNGMSSHGHWFVTSKADGAKLIGYYSVALERKYMSSDWAIFKLELVPAQTAPAKITPFCNTPGDVEPYVAAIEAEKILKAAKKAAREAKEAAKDSGK